MSFITKRERIFNDYDLFDLPARNEGKLKAYASCTDARAWSHFCSDKTEHLVELIKRNNETCRPKYLPTDVIVNTLMVAKNAEITRLKRKIEEFEQMILAYDQLDLNYDQKYEIANAHAAIRAANKELDDMCLDLDLSGFTEGIDSEGFQTGQSRGDEPRFRYNETIKSKGSDVWSSDELGADSETKNNQVELSFTRDASTYVNDPRIEEMQEAIISKDAKLSAMQNTIAVSKLLSKNVKGLKLFCSERGLLHQPLHFVNIFTAQDKAIDLYKVMENDVCEPYCIYAHIYTSLEKIFGVLCQNIKYKHYLDQLTSGKDTRCIDIQGRILFKLKVLEKFSLALIAPCSQASSPSSEDCECYHTEIIAHVETTVALTSLEPSKPRLDDKRAHLVADIMKNDEMKEILSKDSVTAKLEDEQIADEVFGVDNYSIDAENLNRLKKLQVNYEELMSCYEDLKHEKECLKIRCQKYEEVEKEFVALQDQLREYKALWNEKEHYRKRSEDLDELKKQYFILSEETCNLETELKAESEINSIKSCTIEELRSDNIALEKKLNEAFIAHEKEKNTLQCKLKECECKVMCQDQQIKSLTTQIDRLLEQDHNQEHATQSIDTIDKIESMKHTINNLKDALCFNEEEKQQLQEQFEDRLNLINDLKIEIENWKSKYEKSIQFNDLLEKHSENLQDEINKLTDKNIALAQDVEKETIAVENLMSIVNNKSQEINKLMDEVNEKNKEITELRNRLHNARENYDNSVVTLKTEKEQVLKSLQLARQESQELIEKVKDYDDIVKKKADISKSLEEQETDYNNLKIILKEIEEERKRLQIDLDSKNNDYNILEQEIKRLQEIINNVVGNISDLENEKNQYKISLELTKKESEIIEGKLMQFQDLREQLNNLQNAHEQLNKEKNILESELRSKENELGTTKYSVELTKKESEILMDKLQKAENLKEELVKLSEAYRELVKDKQNLETDIADKNRNLDILMNSLNNLKAENEQISSLKQKILEYKNIYEELLKEKNDLQIDLDNKTEEINNLHNHLDSKVEENRDLIKQIESSKQHQLAVKDSIKTLQDANLDTQTTLNAVKKESVALLEKLKQYEILANEYDKLKRAHNQLKEEKEQLKVQLEEQIADLRRMQEENLELNSQSQNLLAHNEDLETALITSRNELIIKTLSKTSYTDVIQEVESLKKEKLATQRKIRDLLDKLDESENIISNISEEVLARDDKIAILENHINALEDEVRRLHKNLSDVVDTSEQIKDNSYQKIDESLNKMEAHHSKATHNIKMELAKIQNENAKLEEQLSVTKIKTEESFRDKHKYLSQIIHLQNEKEIIVTDIKQLELSNVGDSNLSPENCNVEDVLYSLDRIRKCLDVKNTKSTSLEQTLLKVQTSSQLLLSKADEAKRIVEKEKQKIINEKEEAIADRLNMEKQLLDLKEKLEIQISNDKKIINDLEGEVLNQKLIIDKINSSTKNYVTKLEDEINTLQSMYQNSMAKVSELQEKVQNLSEENTKKLDIIEKIKLELEQKSKELTGLQKRLHELTNKPTIDLGVQVQMTSNHINMKTQTDKDYWLEKNEEVLRYTESSSKDNKDGTKNMENRTDINIFKVNKPLQDNVSELIPKQTSPAANEVQILTANIEPTFDFVKNNYMNYKLKRLSPGRLEQYSISGLNQNVDSINGGSMFSDNFFSEYLDELTQNKKSSYSKPENSDLVDIFKRRSITNLSKVSRNIREENMLEYGLDPQSATKSSGFTGLGLTNDFFESESNVNTNKYQDSNIFIVSTSEQSTDKDLFVIYRDSESNYADKGWNENENPEILVESVKVEPVTQERLNSKKQPKQVRRMKSQKEDLYHEAEEENEDAILKHKLNIAIPRVQMESPSMMTTSNATKQTLDSYTLSANPSLKTSPNSDTDGVQDSKGTRNGSYLPTMSHNEQISKQNYNKSRIHAAHANDIKQKNMYWENESHHKLSRVGDDFVLMSSKNDHNEVNKQFNEPSSFGLEYILNTVQREVDPEHIAMYNGTRAPRKSRSDDMINPDRFLNANDSSPSKLSPLKLSLIDDKSFSHKTSKTSEKSQTVSFIEQSVIVKLDSTEDYENQIIYLTKALENIEKDYKKKIEAIKVQYDMNIKNIINEHNQGVQSIQGLHEETLQDIIKIHENEVENLRSMSIEAMRKAEKLEKENRLLKSTFHDSYACLDEEPVKITLPETRRRKSKCRGDTKMLTKTNVEAFNVKPKLRFHGPCTCSLDVNISETIRNIFEQVDVEQRKIAENTYLKYIATKILNSNVETLDAQELSFLHLKVCRTWKTKLNKEETLQKKIDSLENELMNKQRSAQQHIAELDRKVAEERRRLQEVREAVSRTAPPESRNTNPSAGACCEPLPAPPPTTPRAEKDYLYDCNSGAALDVDSRRSAGDLLQTVSSTFRNKRGKTESNRAVLAKLDIEERREKKLFNDEPPTRLRRLHDRPPPRPHKK